jgi:F-type H+-transporting ATPase subunit beta
MKGKLVSLKDSLDGCERILRDEFKDYPESALYMIGAIGEAKKPEVKQPEEKKPEAKQPETKKSEANKPEAKRPDAEQPETKRSNENEPETQKADPQSKAANASPHES